jgi:glycosyltransferase involved in cell wall biosynthesis
MVDILLATYNSSPFLAEALDSVIGQDCADWRLIIRDGDSEDATPQILERYAQLYPDKISVLPAGGRSSACANFSALLAASTAPYVMFCDHDDVWLPGKLSRSLARLKQQEEKDGADMPIVLFTDMLVADERLAVISRSYLRFQHLDPRNVDLNHLLVQNVPSGCTLLVNRAVVEACGTIPPEAVMHDHWLALVGAALGTIVYLDEPTLLYRQHGRNIFGASEYGLRYLLRRALSGISIVRERFYQNVTQATLFLDRYKDRLNDDDTRVLQVFSSLQNLGWWERRRALLRHRILKTGLLRNIGMMLIV